MTKNPRDVFQSLDVNGDGMLSPEEVTRGLRLSGLFVPNVAALNKLMHLMDTDGDGSISLNEFLAFYKVRRQELLTAYEKLMEASKLGDKGVTLRTLRVVAEESGVKLSEKDCINLMMKLDKNQDGVITFDDFLETLLLAPDFNPAAFFDNWFLYGLHSDDQKGPMTTPTHNKDETFQEAAVKKFINGAAAGVLSRTLTAPFDRIRVVMMTNATRITVVVAIRNILSENGVASLWVGNGINCTKVAPEMGIKLLCFGELKRLICADETKITGKERFAAGALSGAFAQGLVYPLEVVRTRFGAIGGRAQYKGIWDCLRRTFAEGGVRALYAGITPSMVGILPYAGVDLALNSYLQDRAATHQGVKHHRDVSVPLLLMCGFCSSMAATAVTFPLYVLRTKLQATGMSIGDGIRMLGKDGYKGFYRGFVPTLVKTVPATSITYASYEYFCRLW